MICVEKMRKYFNKMFDKITAKRIIKDIKLNIKYDDIGTKRVGVWWDAISEGTIKILQDKGYVVRKSATNNNRFLCYLETLTLESHLMIKNLFQQKKVRNKICQIIQI